MPSDFDSIKIGVCECYWLPNGTVDEVHLGLTKGGVELTYTPEWHDMTVDQYGKTPVDEVLIGETLSIKIPLAETDLTKLKMFAHTATWDDKYKKLTFGQYPGLRLSTKAGRLRLHPISFGADTSEDVTVYRAVNKGQLQLAYKVDEERIFQTEFVGMIVKNNPNGAFIWEIGDSKLGAPSQLLPDLSNLEILCQNSGVVFTIEPTVVPDIYSTAVPGDLPPKLNTFPFTCKVMYNYQEYDITDKVTYTLSDPTSGGLPIVTASGGSTPAPVIDITTAGVVTSKDKATLNALFIGSTAIADSSELITVVSLEYAGHTHSENIKVIVN